MEYVHFKNFSKILINNNITNRTGKEIILSFTFLSTGIPQFTKVT